MNRKQIWTVTALLLGVTSVGAVKLAEQPKAPASTRWVLVGPITTEGQKGTTYANVAGIVRNGSRAEMEVLTDWQSPTPPFGAPRASEVLLWEFECDAKLFGGITIKTYSKHMATGQVLMESPPNRNRALEAIPPGKDGKGVRDVFAYACLNKK